MSQPQQPVCRTCLSALRLSVTAVCTMGAIDYRIENASQFLVSRLPYETIRRLARGERRKGANEGGERRMIARRYRGALFGLLNELRRAELEALCADLGIESHGRIGEIRLSVWHWAARAEAGGDDYLGSRLQPIPRLLRGKLIHFGAQPGIAPDVNGRPMDVPAPQPLQPFEGEPETLEELLDRASTLIGVRLGKQQSHKGAYGAAVARCLGLEEDGAAEPDWRGEVEIKTVPVVRDGGGMWFVKEDPAVSMDTVRPLSKLVRVLWIARVADEDNAPVLSWFYQECDPSITDLIKRDLHKRPKGGAGATTKGWYLHKRFFVDSGLLLSLNGA